VTVLLIEEVAYYRIGQFLFSYIQNPRAAENEYTAHSVFLGELNEGGRKRGRSLAEGVTTHSGLEMCAAGKMLTAQFQSCRGNKR
jgi:hypothetical protein